MTQLEMMGANAKQAARVLMNAGAKKDEALLSIAQALRDNAAAIIAANEKDIENGKAAGLTPSLLDRLKLDESRIAGMAEGVTQVAAQPDPIGRILEGRTLKNGLQIEKITVPMGVIGIIYEARPNVTSDAAALCLKAGSAVILRGGKEAINSNKAIAAVMRDAIERAGLPRDCVALVEDTSRQSATELMQLSEYLDVLIPRGGAGLIKSVVANAKVPVIETGVGNCHVYVDKTAEQTSSTTPKPRVPRCATPSKPFWYTRTSRSRRFPLSRRRSTKRTWSCAAVSARAPFWATA